MFRSSAGSSRLQSWRIRNPNIPRAGRVEAAHGGAAGRGGAGRDRTGRRRIGSPWRQPCFVSPRHRRQLFWTILGKNEHRKSYVNRWRNKSSGWPTVGQRFIRGLFARPRALFVPGFWPVYWRLRICFCKLFSFKACPVIGPKIQVGPLLLPWRHPHLRRTPSLWLRFLSGDRWQGVFRSSEPEDRTTPHPSSKNHRLFEENPSSKNPLHLRRISYLRCSSPKIGSNIATDPVPRPTVPPCAAMARPARTLRAVLRIKTY